MGCEIKQVKGRLDVVKLHAYNILPSRRHSEYLHEMGEKHRNDKTKGSLIRVSSGSRKTETHTIHSRKGKRSFSDLMETFSCRLIKRLRLSLRTFILMNSQGAYSCAFGSKPPHTHTSHY